MTKISDPSIEVNEFSEVNKFLEREKFKSEKFKVDSHYKFFRLLGNNKDFFFVVFDYVVEYFQEDIKELRETKSGETKIYFLEKKNDFVFHVSNFSLIHDLEDQIAFKYMDISFKYRDVLDNVRNQIRNEIDNPQINSYNDSENFKKIVHDQLDQEVKYISELDARPFPSTVIDEDYSIESIYEFGLGIFKSEKYIDYKFRISITYDNINRLSNIISNIITYERNELVIKKFLSDITLKFEKLDIIMSHRKNLKMCNELSELLQNFIYRFNYVIQQEASNHSIKYLNQSIDMNDRYLYSSSMKKEESLKECKIENDPNYFNNFSYKFLSYLVKTHVGENCIENKEKGVKQKLSFIWRFMKEKDKEIAEFNFNLTQNEYKNIIKKYYDLNLANMDETSSYSHNYKPILNNLWKLFKSNYT